MSAVNENTTLLSNGRLKSKVYSNGGGVQQLQQQKHSHYIDVLEKPIHNGYVRILDEDRFSADLTLEELLPFVDDPWWQKLRLTLLCTCILVFWLILFAACALAYMQHDKQCKISINIALIPTTTTTTAEGMLQNI